MGVLVREGMLDSLVGVISIYECPVCLFLWSISLSVV